MRVDRAYISHGPRKNKVATDTTKVKRLKFKTRLNLY